jgi:hypothetical protein
LRTHDVNEVLITTHDRGHANWVETTIIDGLHNQLRLPIQELVVNHKRTLRNR